MERCDQKKQIGRVRLQVILDYSAYSLETFITLNIQPGSKIATDAWSSYSSFVKEQYQHMPTNQSKAADDYNSSYGVHIIASLVKRLIRGTFQGRFEPKYLQNHLDEYVFRFNRRKSRYIGKKFMRIVQQVVKSSKIKWDLDPISEFFALELSG